MPAAPTANSDKTKGPAVERLSLLVLYQAPGRTRDSVPLGQKLYDGLQRFGEVPLDAMGRILGGLDQYELKVTQNAAYRYPEAENQICERNGDWIASQTENAILLNLGVGGTGGGAKTAMAVKNVPSAEMPLATILNDQKRDFADAARAEMVRHKIPVDRIKLAVGDMFKGATWNLIDDQISKISKTNRKLAGSSRLMVLLQSPTYNNFSDSDVERLQNFVFKANASSVIFCPAIDCTTDVALLRAAYDTPATRQFALTAVAHHCWTTGHINFDPVKATSEVAIYEDDQGSRAIQHVVREHNRTYVFDPIRRFPKTLLLSKFEKAGLEVIKHMPHEIEGCPEFEYGYWALRRRSRPPEPGP